MTVKAPDWAVDELRAVMASSMANSEEVMRMQLYMESLVFMTQIMPPVQILEYACGGNSKSARSLLRNNVWSGLHKFVSPKCFHNPDEFRIQGGQFAAARITTIQECSPGCPLVEAVWKAFVSGESIMCRPLYGKTTAYYRWNRCGKIWEMNWGFPSITGNPASTHSLRSFTRRLRACQITAMFTSDPTKVDIDNGIFPEDSELATFLESPFARQAYVQEFIVPWILENSALDCKAYLLNPSPAILQDTRRVIATMANGGIDLPIEFMNPEEEDKRVSAAKNIVIAAFKETEGTGLIKTYNAKKLKKYRRELQGE